MTVLEHYERTRCYWCFEWSLSSLETRSNHHTMNHTQCINPCMVEKKTLMFIIFFTSMLKRGGVGGFWFLSSNFKKETWCYAISWCAMFVLYTGSGEMLLLTTDSGMDWLSVVFFSAVWAMSWCCDVMVALMMSRCRVSMRSQWRRQWMLLDVVMQKTFWWI